MPKEIFEIIFDADGSKASSAFAQVGSSAKKELGDAEKAAGGFLDKLSNDSPKASSALDKVAASSQGFISNIVRDLPAAGTEIESLATRSDATAGAFTRLETSAKTGLGGAKTAAKDLTKEVESGSTSITARLKNIGSAAEEIGSKFNKVLPGAAGQLESLGQKASGVSGLVGTAMPAAIIGGGAVIAAFAAKATSDFQHLAQEVLHFQQVAGGTAEEASRWVQTADDFGVSTEQMSSAMGKFEKSIGTSPQKLADLGVQLAHTKDGGIDLQTTFYNVVDAYNATSDETQKATIAQAAFGKQWQGLVKLLDAGSASIKQDFQSISSGQILSQKDLENSEKFRLAIDDLHDELQSLEVSIGRAVIPELTDLAAALKTVGDVAGRVGGTTGVGLFSNAFVDAINPIHRVEDGFKNLQEQATKVELVTPHIVSFKDATKDVAITAVDAAAYVKAMSGTFTDIDKSAQTATKAYDAHNKALNDLRDAYDSDTAVMISNMGISDKGMENMAKDAQELFKAMQSSFDSSTDVVSHFADQGKVSTKDVIKWMKDQVNEAHTWSDGLKTLAADGIDGGILKKLEEAGPKSAPLITALLDAVKRGDLDAINSMQADLNTTLTNAQNEATTHQPEFASAGTALGASMKDGATTALDGMGGVLGSAAVTAAEAAKYASLPSWVDAGSALGQAFIQAAAVNISNYQPATTPNQGGGKDFRVKAEGGLLEPGKLTLVGERGPELIVPGIAAKTVIPNDVLRAGLGGGVNATININAPVYGVNDLEGAIYGALDQVRRRAMVGVR